MGITIANRQRLLKINRIRLHRNADYWLDFLSTSENQMSLVFIRDNKMQILNSQYREIHETTDVLAFPDIYRIKPNKISNNFAENTFLGDIVISTDEVLRLSIEESKELDELIDELFLHGILHLHDYDHQNKKESLRMKRIERKLFSNRPN